MNLLNNGIDELNGKKNSSIYLFKYRMLSVGKPVHFEIVNQLMKKFGQVLKERSTKK
ncbi:hypothetical protein [Paraclostridium sordellii]|uniref:hypothetical protein n=1 Tax=Paraclostridium sordellii TaxID=1505 RepID=UPI0012D8425A|nr:hypothetical protein [Paeniclostridium sordellii]